MVPLSEADEDPSPCLAKLAEKCGPQLVSDVHLVQWGYDWRNPKWVEGLAALRAVGVPCMAHSTLDEEAVAQLQSKALVSFDPDLYVSSAALELLTQSMEARSTWPLLATDHFAVSSEVWIITEEAQRKNPRAWADAALAYGWLLVVLFLDTLRHYWHLGCYHRSIDLTARLVSATYPNRINVAPHRWWWPWGPLGTGISAPQNARGGCFIAPAQHSQGTAFVLRVVRAHRGLGLGLWIIPFAIYYCAMAFPWWALVLPNSYLPWWMLRTIDPRSWPWYWQMAHVGQILVAALVAYNQLHMRVPWPALQAMHIVCFPLFLASAPFFMLYARLSNSRALFAASAAAAAKVKAE